MSRKKLPVRALPSGIIPSAPYALFKATPDGVREATRAEVIAAGMAYASQEMTKGDYFSAPARTREFLRMRLADMPFEVFAACMLDNRHRLIEYVEMFRGTIDGASVHPREVVREIMRVNAAAVIFVHNHPSGVPEASQADELITRRLRDALALIDVRVLDHFIIAPTATLSFAERGLL